MQRTRLWGRFVSSISGGDSLNDYGESKGIQHTVAPPIREVQISL